MSADQVYFGFWINWTDDRVHGATLTLSSSAGTYLIAFLAVIVRAAGDAYWNILCFALFQLRSSPNRSDGLFRQQQVLFRNKFSDIQASWRFLKLSWSWKGRENGAFAGSAGFALLAICHCIAFAVACIFTSRVARTYSDVLLKDVACGTWNHSMAVNADTIVPVIEWTGEAVRKTRAGSQYAQTCYTGNQPDGQASACDAYGGRQITWSVSNITNCPFEESVCKTSQGITFDTGVLDSHLDFGINAHARDRVGYRKLLNCAPLATDGFMSGWSTAEDIEFPEFPQNGKWPDRDQLYLAFGYGKNVAYNMSATYIWGNDSFGTTFGVSGSTPFSLDVESYLTNYPSNSTFIPVPELKRADGDVSIIFLAQDLQYLAPVTDPWFDAQLPKSRTAQDLTSLSNVIDWYLPTYPVSPLGCIEQHQWCNPNLKGTTACTNLTGVIRSDEAIISRVSDIIGLNPKQRQVFSRMSSYVVDSLLYNVVYELGGSSLLASQAIFPPYGPAIPHDQWVQELNHWFGTMMTEMQIAATQFVSGYGKPSLNKFNIRPTSSDAEWMCHSQMVQRSDVESFSVLWIALIISASGFLIVLDLVLPNTVHRYRQLSQRDLQKDNEWAESDVMRLQELADAYNESERLRNESLATAFEQSPYKDGGSYGPDKVVYAKADVEHGLHSPVYQRDDVGTFRSRFETSTILGQ